MLEYGSEKIYCFEPLYRKTSWRNASDLVDRLRNKDFFINQTWKFISNDGYKILERLDMGKKGDTFHSIMRIFWSHKEILPDDLQRHSNQFIQRKCLKYLYSLFYQGSSVKSKSK